MAEPAVEEAPDEEEADPDTNGEATSDDDVEMVQTDVATTGADPDGFFDDVETETKGSSADNDLFDGVETGSSGSSGDSNTEPAETKTTGIAADINRGVSRLAVVGLDDEWETEDGKTRKKKDLQNEFEEVFEAFRLGHYGSEVIEEYLMLEDEDIHPVWGLVGAMLICAAVVVYRRPDGDQLIDAGKVRLGSVNLPTGKD